MTALRNCAGLAVMLVALPGAIAVVLTARLTWRALQWLAAWKP